MFAEAAPVIAAELCLDHFLKRGDNEEGRLERFLKQADQAEALAKEKMPKPPDDGYREKKSKTIDLMTL